MEEKLINLNEAANHLGVSSEELRRLVDTGKIPAYQIGGVFLRFKRSQLEEIKQGARRVRSALRVQGARRIQGDYSFREKLKDFLYFNDFYIISLSIILIILVIIFI